MSDDEMMARFFASYVSPSERPIAPVRAYDVDAKVDCKHCGSVTPLHRDWCMACGKNHIVAPTILPSAEPVLPEGWTYRPHKEPFIAIAYRDDNPSRFVGFDRTASGEKMRHCACKPGEFPDVERYVLWKNGVAQ